MLTTERSYIRRERDGGELAPVYFWGRVSGLNPSEGRLALRVEVCRARRGGKSGGDDAEDELPFHFSYGPLPPLILPEQQPPLKRYNCLPWGDFTRVNVPYILTNG